MTHAVANATNILRACSALGMETVLYSFCKDESKTKGLAQRPRARAEQSYRACGRPSCWGISTQWLGPPLPA